MKRASRNGLSLLESMVTLALTVVVLVSAGLHLREAARLGLAPLDQGWEEQSLALAQAARDGQAAYQVQISGPQLELRLCSLGTPGRLPSSSALWTWNETPRRLRYLVEGGQLWRRQLQADGGLAFQAALCSADSWNAGLSPDQRCLSLSLQRGQRRLTREVYRWSW